MTLFASGLHDVEQGSLGSGIYDGKTGIRSYSFTQSKGTRLISVKSIEECGSEEARQGERLFVKQDISKYSWRILDEGKRSVEIQEICGCTFHAEFELEEADENFGCYVFMGFHGTRTFGGMRNPRGIVSCGVVHFENKPNDSHLPNVTVPSEGQ